ncbi:MAG: Gfo/Idh/MocA family oxidoreductase [Nitrososphaerota archaeon]
MNATFRVGFLGVAHFHAESYAKALKKIPGCEIVGVYEEDTALGKRFGEEFKIECYRSISELLDKNLDAVIITSENSKHHEYIVQALDNDLHILCEKPMTINIRDAEDVVSRVSKKGVKFQMCYVMRYHTVSILVKELIDSGILGKPILMAGTNKLNRALPLLRNWFTNLSLSGGGAVMDHTVHLADLMRWYTEDEVVEVYTEIGKNVNKAISVEDNFFTTVRFGSGLIGHIDGSWTYASGFYTWGDVTMEIIGTDGAILMDAFRQNVYLIGDKHPGDRLSWSYYGCDPDLEMVRDFKRCIQEDKPPRATAKDGLEGVRISLASYESSKRGEPVQLHQL